MLNKERAWILFSRGFSYSSIPCPCPSPTSSFLIHILICKHSRLSQFSTLCRILLNSRLNIPKYVSVMFAFFMPITKSRREKINGYVQFYIQYPFLTMSFRCIRPYCVFLSQQKHDLIIQSKKTIAEHEGHTHTYLIHHNVRDFTSHLQCHCDNNIPYSQMLFIQVYYLYKLCCLLSLPSAPCQNKLY